MPRQYIHDIIRENMLRRDGVITDPLPEPISYNDMLALQWGEEWQAVLQLMQNRMVMGGYRYGPTKKQKPYQYDNIGDMHRRLDLFCDTGNMEHLVDVANIAIISCLKKDHPIFHFKATDDGVHAKSK